MAEKLRAAADDPNEIPHIEPGLVRMVRSWEKGDYKPSETYRLLYCKVFGVSEEELFGDDVTPAGETGGRSPITDNQRKTEASEYSSPPADDGKMAAARPPVIVTGATANTRRCARCKANLAGDNPDDICRPCQRAIRNEQMNQSAHAKPAEIRERPILGTRIRELRLEHGWTQEALASHAGLSPDLVRKIEQGRKNTPRITSLDALAAALGVSIAELMTEPRVKNLAGQPREITAHPRNDEERAEDAIDALKRIEKINRSTVHPESSSAGLQVVTQRYMEQRGISLRALAKSIHHDPSHVSKALRGIKPCGAALARAIDYALNADGEIIQAAAQAIELDGGSLIALKSEEKSLVELLRRTFLAGGLAALTLPALGLDELKHITAAVVNAQRYAGSDIVDYFRRELDNCALNDGRRGPRQSLPIVLGLIAAIEKMAADAKPAIRRDLLRVGAYASEFAGWLYRDVCVPELANYWRDRAIEWAQVSGDATMQGYVLLKKSQAVWDERDALRMLTLAEAAQEGPWRLPARVRAEAAQQQARGHAMLDGNLALVESKLSEARSLLDQDRANADARTTEVAAHYDEALFGLQVAICYCEAGQPERSLELYDRWLSPETFSRRDYAYFLALKGEAHATAEEPDNAATAGLKAFSLARETESVRTVQELTRLAVQLEQWRDKESVHDLRKSVLVG